MLLARISVNLSRHSSLSSIASGRSSRLHHVSVQRYCRKVIVIRPTLTRPCEWGNRRTQLINTSLLLQQRPACLIRLIWMVLEMVGWWSYSCCFVGYWFQDLFNIARSILVKFSSSHFSIRPVSVYVVHPYNSTETNAAWNDYQIM